MTHMLIRQPPSQILTCLGVRVFLPFTQVTCAVFHVLASIPLNHNYHFSTWVYRHIFFFKVKHEKSCLLAKESSYFPMNQMIRVIVYHLWAFNQSYGEQTNICTVYSLKLFRLRPIITIYSKRDNFYLEFYDHEGDSPWYVSWSMNVSQ